MEREILFRGKKRNSGEWIKGLLVAGFDGRYFIQVRTDLPFAKLSGHVCTEYFVQTQVDISTIGQFTGLKDKNGVKIFEGDVIEEGIVHWNDEYLGFFVKGDFAEGENKPLYDIPLPDVIGNIHDNPKLIKKVEA